MKKVNPEDLVVGQECYIKVVTEKVKISDRSPVLRDIAGNFYYPSRGEPIYALDDQPNHPDPELEMLVNVASRIYTDPIFDDGFDEAAKCASDLIAACKNQLKQQS